VMPPEITEALQTMDKDSWRVSLTKRSGETMSSTRSAVTWAQLKSLEYLDKANNWFAKSVIAVWPKFGVRNAASTVTMNFMDIGDKVLSARLNFNVSRMLENVHNPEFLKGITFKNDFGHIMTGEEMLAALQENGVFVKFSRQADVKGAENFIEDFGS